MCGARFREKRLEMRVWEDMRRTTLSPGWHPLTPPQEALMISNDEVHVWRAALELPAWQVLAYARLLSREEQARAAQFRFEQDRSRFVVARGTLRALLSNYLHTEASLLRFTYNPFGKPTLAGETGDQRLHFNVTHTRELALYAVTRMGAIGIDLEYIRTLQNPGLIVEHFFSSREVRDWHSVSRENRRDVFFVGWTRKEAYVKARGMGLSLDTRNFTISLLPGEPARLVESKEQGVDVSDWSLFDLDPNSGYRAALAVQGHPARLLCWQWR